MTLPGDELRELQEHRRVRVEKLLELERQGIDAFPMRTDRSHSAAEALAAFDEAAAEQPEVAVAGRIVTQIKRMGKLLFCHVADASGRIQLAVKHDVLGPERFGLWEQIERADHVSARGRLFKTRTGETTVEVREFAVLAKALRPLPEKWHGLTDVEKRYRQRYLDLIVNPEVRRTFVVRSRVVAAIRRFLDGQGFMEVETPVLQPVYGGAAARPFETHHNALDRKLYLRIALELYLKRLIVGGLDRVYEIGRNFRNEGIDRLHNPEFTMLEAYQAYADYRDIMRLVEEMVSSVARDVLGSTRISFKGNEVDVSPPWRRLPMADALWEHARVDMDADLETLLGSPAVQALRPGPDWHRGKVLDELVSNYVEPRLIQPTFLVDYPVAFPGSTLAKRMPGRDDLVERFEGYVGGFEIANAFTELNDPRDQRARFEEQVALGRGGDDEAHPMDEDYITALEHGMPPCGGLGIGIDRLLMLLTDNPSIREVVLFPQLRDLDGSPHHDSE